MSEELQNAPQTAVLYLNRGNATFCRSAGGLLALEYTTPAGERVREERVIVLRCFPLTAPDTYLSVRRPVADRSEIGMVRQIGDLDEASEELVKEELARRYFVPKVEKIISLRRRGSIYIQALTDVGERLILMRDNVSGFRTLDDGRVMLTDMDGNCFEIPDPNALDKASLRKIEIFL